METKIKTIIFDLGGVVFTDGSKGAIAAISKEFSLPAQDVEKVIKGDLGTQYRIGAITVDEFWNTGKKMWNRAEIANQQLTNIWLEGYKPIPGMFELLDQLNQNGYELLFLSDNVKERVEHLEELYHFQRFFKGGIFSHIAKTRKPDPEIYKKALALTRNRPGECLYTDDKEELLVPAQTLGTQVVHFRSHDQFVSALLGLGIHISPKQPREGLPGLSS